MKLRDRLLLGALIATTGILIGKGLEYSEAVCNKQKEVQVSKTVSDSVESSETVSKSEPEEVEGEEDKKPVETPKPAKKKKTSTPTPTATTTPEPTPDPIPEPEPVVEETTEEYYCTDEYTEVGDPGPEPEVSYEPVLTYYGDCTVTFYCNCESCCGAWSNELGIGAAGVPLTPWYSCANGALPFGTEIYVEGIGYLVVQDRGVGGDWIDVYVSSHEEIPSYGMTTASVYIVG